MFDSLATMEDMFLVDGQELELPPAVFTAQEELELLANLEELNQLFEEFDERAEYLGVVTGVIEDIQQNGYTADTVARQAITLEKMGIDINKAYAADKVLAVLEAEEQGIGSKLKNIWNKIIGFIKKIFGFGKNKVEAAAADADKAEKLDKATEVAANEADKTQPGTSAEVDQVLTQPKWDGLKNALGGVKKKFKNLVEKAKSMTPSAKAQAEEEKVNKLASEGTAFLSKEDYNQANQLLTQFGGSFDFNQFDGKTLPPNLAQIRTQLTAIKPQIGTPAGMGWKITSKSSSIGDGEVKKLKPIMTKMMTAEQKLTTLAQAGASGNNNIDVKAVQEILTCITLCIKVYDFMGKTNLTMAKIKAEVLEEISQKKVDKETPKGKTPADNNQPANNQQPANA